MILQPPGAMDELIGIERLLSTPGPPTSGKAPNEVRKDMHGRYSKHYWPEDLLTATPTHTTKAQMDADH